MSQETPTAVGGGELAVAGVGAHVDGRAAQASGPETADDAAARRYAWRVLSVTSLGVTLTFLNTSTLNVALPAVVRHFEATPGQASWFLLSYGLSTTVLILVFGRLADLVGRRTLYIAGLTVLTVASLACVFAPSSGALIALRTVQGIGAAAVITNTTAQLVDAFPPRLLALGLSLNVTFSSAAVVTGPVLGGALVSALGWRAVFWFNVPVGVVAIAWASLSLRRAPQVGGSRERFDLAGALLSGITLAGLLVALSEGGAAGWSRPAVLVGSAVAIAGLPLFVSVERRRRHPLVDVGLFGERHRAMAYLSTTLMAIGQSSIALLASLYFQSARGMDAFHAGLAITPLSIALMLTSPVAGRLAGSVTPRVLSSVGISTTMVGLTIILAVIGPRTTPLQIGIGLAVMGVGGALFQTPNTASLMSTVPVNRRGVANGLRSMLQNTANVISTAMSLAIITSGLGPTSKKAAYAGKLAGLGESQLGAFLTGYRVAIVVLLALVGTGLAASLSRGPGMNSARSGTPVVPEGSTGESRGARSPRLRRRSARSGS